MLLNSEEAGFSRDSCFWISIWDLLFGVSGGSKLELVLVLMLARPGSVRLRLVTRSIWRFSLSLLGSQ
mgnify:CR=1 FL=1